MERKLKRQKKTLFNNSHYLLKEQKLAINNASYFSIGNMLWNVLNLRSQTTEQYQLILMDSNQLNFIQSPLDEEFQYVQDLKEFKQTIDYCHQTINEEVFSESDVDDISSKTNQDFKINPFDDPHYQNQDYTSRTRKLSAFLPTIIRQYQRETNEQKIKLDYKGLQIEDLDGLASTHMLSTANSKRQLPLAHHPRSRKIKKEQYPTKNMLPSFKSSFLNYLATYFPSKEFEDIEVIRRIRGKNGINLQDYEDLFKKQIFRPYLKKYFKNKMIYRDLLQSRIEFKTKRIYFGKLDIFQEAFNTGVFKGIN